MHYLLVWKDRLGSTNQEYGHMTFLIHVFWRQSRPAQDFLNTTFLYCSAQFKNWTNKDPLFPFEDYFIYSKLTIQDFLKAS